MQKILKFRQVEETNLFEGAKLQFSLGLRQPGSEEFTNRSIACVPSRAHI